MTKTKKNLPFFISAQSWYALHLLALILILGLIGLNRSEIGRYTEARLSQPFLFQLRSLLDMSPELPENIKILALDDSSFAELGGPRLNADQLAALLESIGAKKPSAILIDGLLSDKPSGNIDSLEKLKIAKLPVYSGSFLQNRQIPKRPLLNLDQEAFALEKYTKLSSQDLPPVIKRSAKKWAYANHPSYDGLIHSQGHITYHQDGKIDPLVLIDDNYVLPHLALKSAREIKIESDGLFVNGSRVQVNSDGSIPINYREPEDFYRATRPLRLALRDALEGRPSRYVEAGDVVLILLAFATGNTDFHEASPFGEIPGGLIVASTIADVIDNTWLSTLEVANLFIIAFAMGGIIVGINSDVKRFSLACITITLSYLFICCLSFISSNLILPILFPLLAFTTTSLLHFFHVRLQEEFKLVEIQKNFYQEKAKRLEKESENAKLEGYLELGEAVQNLLLPSRRSDSFQDYDFSMIYQPHLKMSGDWFFVWQASPSERRIFMGDVMGKGPSAAIPVAAIVSILKECQAQQLTLEQSLHHLNRSICQLFNFKITTTITGIILYPNGRCELFNAGGPGWFIQTDQLLQFDLLRSQPLGLSSKLKFSTKRIEINPTDLLFTFTDGYLEGSRQIHQFIKNYKLQPSQSLDQTVAELESQILAFQKVNPQDDKSLLVVKRRLPSS